MSCDIAPVWQYIVALPEPVTSQAVIDLSHAPQVAQFYLFPEGDACARGGGGPLVDPAAVEVTGQTAESVSVRLRNARVRFGEPSEDLVMDGDYVAERCSGP